MERTPRHRVQKPTDQATAEILKDQNRILNQSDASVFDPKEWLGLFRVYSAAKSTQQLREMRKSILEGVYSACANYGYALPNGTNVSLGTALTLIDESAKTAMYQNTHIFPNFPAVEGQKKTQVSAVYGDCLETAFDLVDQGFNPVVLNMANKDSPGGGFQNGAGAQEENLMRRSNYFRHLVSPIVKKTFRYPIPEFGGVYSTNVLVFRGSESKGYPFLESPRQMSFVAVAAYAHPPLESSTRLRDDFAEMTKKKIRTMLSIGLDREHDAIVLSAFGCGAFANPPEHVSALFAEVIAEEKFKNKYRRIVFSIIDDHNATAKQGNFIPFSSTFANF